MGSLAARNKQPEIMDQPGLAPSEHQHALHGLARINWISRSDAILWPAIAQLAREQTGRTLRVLDIATGGGDVPICLAQRVRRQGFPIEFAGIDVSPTAIAHARAAAERAGVSVRFDCLDVLRDMLPGDFDVLTSSLFLHHLEVGEAVDLLRRMKDSARAMVLVNDLIRSRAGYWLAWLGTRLLTRSPIVHVDGPRSVEAAFSIAEAHALANDAGLVGAAIGWRWPFRFLLQWRRPA